MQKRSQALRWRYKKSLHIHKKENPKTSQIYCHLWISEYASMCNYSWRNSSHLNANKLWFLQYFLILYEFFIFLFFILSSTIQHIKTKNGILNRFRIQKKYRHKIWGNLLVKVYYNELRVNDDWEKGKLRKCEIPKKLINRDETKKTLYRERNFPLSD